jgi:hypothetical protein
LLRAFEIAAAARPALSWKLYLVGNRSAGGDAIAREVEEASKRDPRIQWRGVVDDAELHRLYSAADFTVYPSTIEGFGLPILESLWHGRPCICFREGVMGELARDGGCLTTDVNDAQALGETIMKLATDAGQYTRLAREAVERRIRTWGEYAVDVAATVSRRPSGRPAEGVAEPSWGATSTSWNELLYPQGKLDTWQMSDSERIGLTGVLSRVKPGCAIEIGTYHGGSLSAISRYAKSVFSIDIDPDVLNRVPARDNVSFLIGPSTVILPRLFEELELARMPVEFILIDADHSAEGVRRDIEMVLDYQPKRPLVVMLHDGFNPDCRRGMLEARWDRSPYVHYVDIDFIPGRVVEHGGGGDGEMWGGLAFAYFDPTPRQGPLEIRQTAIKAFERAKEASRNPAAPNIRCAS